MAFMFFFLLVFGLLGVENFMGTLQARCVVNGPAPAGYIDMGKDASYLSANTYGRNDTFLWDDEHAAGTMGEFDLWCSKDGNGKQVFIIYISDTCDNVLIPVLVLRVHMPHKHVLPNRLWKPPLRLRRLR